jgi:hypothetical protein
MRQSLLGAKSPGSGIQLETVLNRIRTVAAAPYTSAAARDRFQASSARGKPRSPARNCNSWSFSGLDERLVFVEAFFLKP